MCTYISLKTKDKAVLSGRTHEYESHYRNELLLEKRGTEFPSTFFTKSDRKWKNKYAFYHLISPGVNPVRAINGNGMNEHGLSMGMLAHPIAKMREVKSNELVDENISILYIGMYIVANYKNIKEIKDDLDKLNEIFYWPAEIPQTRDFGQHYYIIDANGDEVVLELEGDKIVLKDNPLGVLTNSQPLENHWENLRRLSSLTTFDSDRPALPLRGLGELKPLSGHGIGFVGLSADYTSDSRFLRAALYVSNIETQKTAEEGVNIVFRILHSVADIVPGITKKRLSSKKDAEFYVDPFWSEDNELTLINHTDTIIVNDSTNLKVYYKTHDNISIRVVDLKEMFNQEKTGVLKLQEDGSSKFTEVKFTEGKTI